MIRRRFRIASDGLQAAGSHILLRRAMINLERESLRGEVEVDETWIGGTQAGLRGSRQLKGRKAALVLVAVVWRNAAA